MIFANIDKIVKSKVKLLHFIVIKITNFYYRTTPFVLNLLFIHTGLTKIHTLKICENKLKITSPMFYLVFPRDKLSSCHKIKKVKKRGFV